MSRKAAIKGFHLDDASHSALVRSVAGELIRRMGTDPYTISRVLDVVQSAASRKEGSCRYFGELSKRDAEQIFKNEEACPNGDAQVKQNLPGIQEQFDSMRLLALAAEFTDDKTGAHMIRVGAYSALIAEKLGLQEPEVQVIYRAAHVHDVGKIGIPDGILTKPDRLSCEEFKIMKTHTTIGSRILATPEAGLLQSAQQVALCHHERWDGKGYPQGISAQAIPLAARIVSVADTLDAITSQRPYRPARSIEEACEVIEAESEKQFDPTIVEAFLTNIEHILTIMEKVNQSVDSALSDFTGNATGSRDCKPTDHQVDLDHDLTKELRDESG